jgi:hypothetical protein
MTRKCLSFSFVIWAGILISFIDNLRVHGQITRDSNFAPATRRSMVVNAMRKGGRHLLTPCSSNESEPSLNISSASPVCHQRAVCYFGNPADNSRVSELNLKADTYVIKASNENETTNYSIIPTRIIPVDDHGLLAWFEAGNVSVAKLAKDFGSSNAWSGLSGFVHGGGAFMQRDISECLRSIRATELDRGFDYETVAFARSDLHWVCRGDDKKPGINECNIPCPHNDWGGACDQYAVCGRFAARAYADVRSATVRFMSTAPPRHRAHRGHELNSEKFLRWRLETQGVKIRRAPDAFVRVCHTPSKDGIVEDAHHKCQKSNELGFEVKTSGDQLAHTHQACGLRGDLLKSPAKVSKPVVKHATKPTAKPATNPVAKPVGKPVAKPAKPTKPSTSPAKPTKPAKPVAVKPAVKPAAKPAKAAGKTAAKAAPKRT